MGLRIRLVACMIYGMDNACPQLSEEQLRSLESHVGFADLFGYMATYLTFTLEEENEVERNKWIQLCIDYLMYLQHSGKYTLSSNSPHKSNTKNEGQNQPEQRTA